MEASPLEAEIDAPVDGVIEVNLVLDCRKIDMVSSFPPNTRLSTCTNTDYDHA